MADQPAPPRSSDQGFGARMSHKVGPLPVWAWAIIALVVGYYLYKKYQASSASTTPATTPAAAAASTPIPSSDQSGGGVGSTSGSSGTTTPIGDNGLQGNGLAGDITTESNGPAANGAPGGLITQRENTSFIPASSGATGISSYSSAGHGL